MGDDAKPPRVGVAGLGMIGGGVARGLIRTGHDIVAFDVRPEAMASIEGSLSVVGSPIELGEAADVVLIAVYDDAQVRDVLGGRTGILSATDPPAAVVILSTVTMDTVRWAADEGHRRNVSILDCGVSGGDAIERGEMVSMIGGDSAAVELVRPLLEAFSAAVFHMGPVGTGMKTKIARNMFHFATRVAAWEAITLAAASGVDPAACLEVLKACGLRSGPYDLLDRGIGWPTPSTVDEQTRRRSGDYAHKDLQAALALGEESAVPLAVARAADRAYDRIVDLGT